jgi:hypothetical protein
MAVRRDTVRRVDHPGADPRDTDRKDPARRGVDPKGTGLRDTGHKVMVRKDMVVPRAVPKAAPAASTHDDSRRRGVAPA